MPDLVARGWLKRVYKRSGVGVPLVAWRSNDGSGGRDALRPPEGLPRAATAVLDRSSSGRLRLRVLDPDRHELVVIGGRVHLLAANFSAPIGYRTPGGANSAPSIRREKLYLGERHRGAAGGDASASRVGSHGQRRLSFSTREGRASGDLHCMPHWGSAGGQLDWRSRPKFYSKGMSGSSRPLAL